MAMRTALRISIVTSSSGMFSSHDENDWSRASFKLDMLISIAPIMMKSTAAIVIPHIAMNTSRVRTAEDLLDRLAASANLLFI